MSGDPPGRARSVERILGSLARADARVTVWVPAGRLTITSGPITLSSLIRLGAAVLWAESRSASSPLRPMFSFFKVFLGVAG